MSVVAERHLDVGVPHDVLQVLGIHARKGHPRAEGVAHRVGRHHVRQRQAVALAVVLNHVPERRGIGLPGHRLPSLVEEEEALPAVDDDGFPWLLPREDAAERHGDLLAQVDLAHAALRLRLVDVETVAALGLEELVVADGGVGVALPRHPQHPALGVGRAHVAYLPSAQLVLPQEAHELFPARLGALPDVGLAAVVPLVELADGHLPAQRVDAIVEVAANLALLLAERQARALALRQAVGLDQPPRVHVARLTHRVHVLEDVPAVLLLALAGAQHAVFVVTSFGIQSSYSPFPYREKSLDMLQPV